MNGLDLLYLPTLLPHYAWHRRVTHKYGPAVTEKTGRLPGPPPAKAGPRLWLHAVSVGEALAARPLARGFSSRFPAWETVVSTTTATGREVARKHYGPERVFYYPLDLSWMAERALDRVDPDAIVLMELELWPNFLRAAARRGLPVIVSNVRITERSARRFGRLPRSWRDALFGTVDLWLCPDPVYADRLRALGVPEERLPLVGSLKYDGVPVGVDPEVRERLRHQLGVGPAQTLLVAGSTHAGEEEALLGVWRSLRASGIDDLRLLVAPRHPERWAEVGRRMERFGPVGRWSGTSRERPAAEPLLLLDAMGVLADTYQAADAVFLGGSLVPVGGHNVLESCGRGRPTVVGPHVHNFADAVRRLREAGALEQAEDAGGVERALREILTDPGRAEAMSAAGCEAVFALQGATERSLERIATLLARTEAE